MKEKSRLRQLDEELPFLVHITPFNSDYWRRKLELSHKLYGKYEERDKREVGYLKVKPNRKDTGLVIIYQPRLWTERSLKMRGWNFDKIFFFRKTVGEEDEQLEQHYRYVAVRVKNLKEFFAEERDLLIDQPEIFRKLERAVLKQFPEYTKEKSNA